MNLPPTLPFKTIFELSQVKIAVSELSRAQYSSESDFAEALASATRAYPALTFIAEKISSFDSIITLKKEIAEFEAHTPVAHIWTAYPLKPELIDRLSSSITSHYKQTYLLDIQLEPQVLGGIACEINGKYIDKTLKTITKAVIDAYV